MTNRGFDSPYPHSERSELWNYTTLLEHFLNGTDRLRFAPAERSGAAEFPPHPPSAAPSREARIFSPPTKFDSRLLVSSHSKINFQGKLFSDSLPYARKFSLFQHDYSFL